MCGEVEHRTGRDGQEHAQQEKKAETGHAIHRPARMHHGAAADCDRRQGRSLQRKDIETGEWWQFGDARKRVSDGVSDRQGQMCPAPKAQNREKVRRAVWRDVPMPRTAKTRQVRTVLQLPAQDCLNVCFRKVITLE